ncbi:MAG: AmmeMemoRadiSam system radical SAM enzyme [Candidatus ainarchaeum sp.]|nr:AmmeMemoRadiSam system radical SAM enzyme [Candidatus ainarchaeum sp.]
MKEAILWKGMPNKEVQCYLCYRMCRVKDGERGYCRIRENRKGKLYALTYGKAIAAEVDPIEKKPFYHFMPGTELFSVATVGCNFRCQFCQNWNISQAFGGMQGEDLPPALIREICKGRNVPGAAYTYTEPTIFMEYALDTAKLLHKDGRFNTFVTNGYMTSAAIGEMVGRIDAARIDLKGFHDKVYKQLCGDVVLEYVLQSIKELHAKMHIELINLIIPGWNDDEGDIRTMCKWVHDLDPRIPVHFIGFYPANFMMDTPPTDLGILRKAREIALEEGLHYAYTGNRQDEETESTYCPKCKARVVRRFGFSVLENKITKDGKCPECGKKLYFVNDMKEYWKKHPRRD